MLGEAEAANIEKREKALKKYNDTIQKNTELTAKRKPLEDKKDAAKGTIKGRKISNAAKEKKITKIQNDKP
jgi:hypothetical protein